MNWYAIPSAIALRDSFNRRFPNRSKGADGTIGDQSHSQRVSDHNPDETGRAEENDADHLNEVHALDITNDLNDPDYSLWDVVLHIVEECKAQRETRLKYVIFNGYIWESFDGFKRKRFNGADKHTGHAHFDFKHTESAAYNDRPWSLIEEYEVSPEDIEKVASRVVEKLMQYDMSYTGQKKLSVYNLLRNVHQGLKLGFVGDWYVSKQFENIVARLTRIESKVNGE